MQFIQNQCHKVLMKKLRDSMIVATCITCTGATVTAACGLAAHLIISNGTPVEMIAACFAVGAVCASIALVSWWDKF